MALEGLWYIGVALEIFSTMTGTIGKQLIRMSEILKRRKPRVSSLCFRLGLIINTVVGPLVDMGAYSFANQSLIAPFGGLDVVWNAMLAPWVLGEKMTKSRGVGCVLILFGTIMAGIFGNHVEPEYTIEYIQDTLLAPRVGIYFACFAAWFFFNRFYLMRKPAGSALRGISLGCTAGTIAGNMFCIKGAIELIQRSISEQDGEIWLHWLPWVLLIGAAFFAISNVGYMTKGLQEYEALFMVTIYEGSMIVSGCVSGSIVLLDLKGLEAWRCVLYFTGVGIIMCGMFVIFREEAKNKSSMLSNTASVTKDRPTSGLGKEVSFNENPLSPSQRSMHTTFDRDVEAARTRAPFESGFSRTVSEEGGPHEARTRSKESSGPTNATTSAPARKSGGSGRISDGQFVLLLPSWTVGKAADMEGEDGNPEQSDVVEAPPPLPPPAGTLEQVRDIEERGAGTSSGSARQQKRVDKDGVHFADPSSLLVAQGIDEPISPISDAAAEGLGLAWPLPLFGCLVGISRPGMGTMR